ncbi:MAG TPA: YdcF family protein [Dongiaceae bacterium]|nr:YdcF family protein [Dongiaceae bacterium]
MFFRCAKLLHFFLRPSNAILLLVIASCLLLLFGFFSLGSLLLLFTALAAGSAAWTPLPYWLLRPLEAAYPAFDPRKLDLAQPVRGILLLGGGVNASRGDHPNGPIFTSAGSRLFVVLELARLFPQATILLSGGVPDLLTNKSSNEAGLTRDLLVRQGISPSRILLEERSRDTFENARESEKLFAGPTDRWLLVTSAAHMPRAMAAFGARAAQILPCCADYKTQGKADDDRFFGSAAHGWLCCDIAAHEWLGLLAYRLSGRIAAFPRGRRPI